MALFQYEGIGSLRSLGNRLTTQRAVYSYNQFSVVNYEELDYGSITDSILEAEDYGEITASIEQYYQIQDFGTITLDTARIPMGKVGVHLAAVDNTTRVSVGGVEFALYGRAITEVFFNPVDRVFDFQGKSVNRITSSWLGRGILPAVEAEALDAVISTPPTSIFHLSTKGSAKTEVIFNQENRIFDIVGEAKESRSYLFDEEDAIDFGSDDWGFLTESVLRSEDYGLITDLQDIPYWDFSNIEDWGLITEDTTTKIHGRMPFGGSAEERFIFANYDGSWGDKQPRLLGTGIDYTIPKHIGEGFINIDGTPRVQIRMHYKADGGWDFYPNRFRGGSLFGFSSTAETSASTESGVGKLFALKSTTTFKAVRDEVGKSEKDILVQGGAFYEVIFNQVDRVFSFANIEINRRAYAYNLSSVVNIESIDYGYITETVSLSDDYGDVGNHDLVYPWETEDYGTLAPTETRLPFGLGRLYSTTGTPRSRTFIGNQEHTHLRVLGTSKVYVLPKFTSKGDLVKLRGDTTFTRARDWVGTGNLPTLSGAADAVAFVPAKDDKALFNFEGNARERIGIGNYDGSGALFGFDSSTISITIITINDGLFTIDGEVAERTVFREIGSGTLSGFTGAAESITYHYTDESSFGACDGDDYGFINESVYNVEESPALSGFLSTPISTLANQIVSEYGRTPNQIDYGYVNQYYQYNHEDYGTLFPDDCLEPQGAFAFRSGVDESRTKIFIGSGKIGSVSGAAEAIGVRPPSISLFAFHGGGTESTTPATEIGSGSLFSYITFSERVAFVPAKADPLFAIDGGLRVSGVNEQESELKFTAAWAASGSLFGIVGSGEATGNEHTGSGSIFIRDSGVRIEPESFTPWIPAGRGSIFSFVSFTEAAAFVPAKKKALFGFSGAATDIQFSFAWETIETKHLLVRGTPKIFVLPKHRGDGSLFIRSSGVRIEAESFTPWIPAGTGSLFGYVGAAEAVGANPPDDFTLFTITGEVDTPLLTFSEQKFVQARFLPDEAFATFQLRVTETGLQPLDIEGKLDESFTPAPAVATGSLFGFSSTTEARVINPPDQTTLFTFVGNVTESETNVEIGSGSFFSFQSATEVTAVAEERQSLFTFAGNLQERVSPAPHVSAGGLFGFVSATEARVIDLPARTTLFSVSGSAVERASVAEDGTATPGLDLNGNLVERSTFAHAGSGGLFGFSSTTEARVIVPRGLRNIFTVNGEVADSVTRPYIGSGTLVGFVGGAESTSNAEVKYTLFSVNGTPEIRFTANNPTSGQVRVGLSNPGIPGDISRGITVFRLRTFPQGPVVRFSGTKAESFTPAPHIVEGLININRADEVTKTAYIEFRKPHPTRIVVI